MADPFAETPVETIDLDVRFLQPPEPFERTVEALDRLGAGGELRLLIHREPHPLYQMLRQSGYVYRAEPLDEATWRIRIRLAEPVSG